MILRSDEVGEVEVVEGGWVYAATHGEEQEIFTDWEQIDESARVQLVELANEIEKKSLRLQELIFTLPGVGHSTDLYLVPTAETQVQVSNI